MNLDPALHVDRNPRGVEDVWMELLVLSFCDLKTHIYLGSVFITWHLSVNKMESIDTEIVRCNIKMNDQATRKNIFTLLFLSTFPLPFNHHQSDLIKCFRAFDV